MSVAELNEETTPQVDLTDEEVNAVLAGGLPTGFAQIQIDANKTYIEFDSSELAKALGPFVERKKAGRDLVSRSMLLIPKDDHVEMYSTDGTSYLRAKVTAKINRFTRTVICDTKTLHVISRSGARKMYLLDEGGALHSDFYGGRIFIQTFTFDQGVFQKKVPAAFERKVTVPTATYTKALASLCRIAENTDIPDLCYLFFEPEGAYASNGAIVAKVDGSYIDCTVRQKDATILNMLLTDFGKEELTITTYPSMVVVESGAFEYAFPLVNKHIPGDLKTRPRRLDSRFHVSAPFLRSVLGVFAAMPDCAGVISLDFGDTVRGVMRSKKGDPSDFSLTEARTGEPHKGKVQISIRSLLSALHPFTNDTNVAMALTEDGALNVFSPDRTVGFLARQS